MDTTAIIIITAIAVPVAALATWIWIVVERVDKEFRAGLEGIHFDL